MSPATPVFLLSDFGYRDAWVGVMRAVLLGLAPAARPCDLTHGVARQDVDHGALQLEAAWPYLPDGAIVLAVVDPGVGGERRGVAARVRAGDGRRLWLVAPDNGLLEPVLADARVEAAVALRRGAVRPPGPGRTFDGRDLFAPAAGALAAGRPLADLGPPLDAAALVRRPAPPPRREADGWSGQVRARDDFGNLVTNLPPEALAGGAARLEVAGRTVNAVGRAFADVPKGAAVAYVGSLGTVEVALREGDAAAAWGVAPGAPVRVRSGGV